MAIVIKKKDSIEFYNRGIFNWGIALFSYMKEGNRDKILLFRNRRNNEYERYITFKCVCGFKTNIIKNATIAYEGGYKVQNEIDTFVKTREWLAKHKGYDLPIFDKEIKRFIGIAYNDVDQDVLLKHIEVCIQHEKDWKIFNKDICIDVSEISECSKAIYLLSMKWHFQVYNDNICWQYFDDTIKISNFENKRSDLEDKGMFFLNLVKRNELIDVCKILLQLEEAGISTYLFKVPSFDELDKHTENEKYRHDMEITGFSQPDSPAIEKQLRIVYGEDYELYRRHELPEVAQYSRKNVMKMKDVQRTYCNVIDGKRVTIGNEGHDKKIHVYGPCIVGAAFTKDEDTIPSKLQKEINLKKYHYDVINYGTYGYYRSYINKICSSFIYTGDIVVIIDTFEDDWLKNEQKKFISLKDVIDKRVQDIFFEQPYHLNKIGNESLAKGIFELIELDLNNAETQRERIKVSGWEGYGGNSINNEIDEWSKKYNKFPYDEDKIYGGIVMNCNPFTNGHLFLIKKALEMVDYLYVFVVEEDRSDFSFKDRFNMVEEALKDNDNVMILPSGKWILSNETMPEYFRKSVDKEQIICSSDDIEIFAEEIAPLFHITKRFVGEELLDNVTKQYNEGMKRILPKYGIELIEIPRHKVDGEIVSASMVRKKLEFGDYDSILSLVPRSTYLYIKNLKK